MKFAGLQNSIKAAAAAATLCVLAPAAWGQGIGVSTLGDLMTSTPQKLERGKKIWNENCVSCHGANGDGTGPNAQYFSGGLPNLAAAAYRHGGGPLQVHNLIERGEYGHPLFEHLPYQDLWAVTHYVRSLGPTQNLTDPPELVAQAKFEAREGVCSPTVKAGIDDKMKFMGDEQIKQGEAVFAANCTSCHGEDGKGDGTAAAALDPKPRNFHSGEGWTNGTSALAIFNTIANGVDGTAMASFKHLPEADRWALTHMIRQKWVPADARAEPTPEQVDAVCRSLSGGGGGATIPIESAMKFVVGDVDEDRIIRMKHYGTAWVEGSANITRGQELYEKHCQSCHGPRGVGTTMGPYGSQPPYLVVKVNRLEPGTAGGTYKDFALRSIGGAHIAIPDVTGASQIADKDWASLHAYVTSFEGAGEVRPIADRPAASIGEEPSLETVPAEPAPTDVAPTGAAPTGAAPTGAAPSGDVKDGSAKTPKAKPATEPKAKPAAKPAAEKKPEPKPAADAAAPKEQPAAASEE